METCFEQDFYYKIPQENNTWPWQLRKITKKYSY